MPSSSAAVDPMSGYSAATRTFHSLREPIPLPPPALPLSFPAFALSFLPSPLPSHSSFIDSSTGEAVPFPAFLGQVRALATALRSHLRVSRGDVAIVLAPPSLHVPVLYFALMAVGAVVSPANPALTTGELAGIAALSKPSLAFAVSSTASKLPPGLDTVLLDSTRFLSFLQGPPGDASAMDTPVIQQSDPAAILYSSGTTGRAKAVVMTHRNLMTSRVVTPGPAPEVLLLTVPVFHVYGFVSCLRSVMTAHTLVLHTARRFDARGVLGAVGRFRVTRLALAPPALLAIVRTAEEEDENVTASAATLRAVLCGGASVSPELMRRFSHKFPHVCITQGYGLTETTAGFCRSVGVEESRRIGSVGRLLWGTEAKIVDPGTGVALPPGVPGELLVRGPFVMKGYLGDKESTSKILDSEGWLRTGDVCVIANDGFLFVVDRMKELIKCKGYQVAPAELEDLLQTHPGIDEAAVVGYPDDQAGELPVAFVVRRSGSNLHEAQIKAFVAKLVVHYKRIHRVFLVDSIPKNAAGKILRKNLAKLALHQIRANV